MFDEKDKVKFLAEGLRNISTGLIIAGFVAMATTPFLINAIVIAGAGFFVFASAYKIYED